MGRHIKTIVTADGVDRRENGYYATPSFVADFLTKQMLGINPDGRYVLDPAVGKEELLNLFHQAGKEIDSFDIEDFGIHKKSNFTHQDFLAFYRNFRDQKFFDQCSRLRYDYYVCNPPYNCHETNYIRKNKKELQVLFPDTGVSNMYSMFISALIDVAKDGAVIGLVTHDSFLTARMHRNLREQILQNCSIHYISLCPTDLFWDQKADVRTCLLILQKGKQYQREVQLSKRPLNTIEFQKILRDRLFDKTDIAQIVLSGKNDNNEFVVGCREEIKQLFNYPRLGEIFRCVTGISTGNDSKYLSKEKNGYFTIPFYKNPGSRRFNMEPDGFLPKDFLNIEKVVSNFMVRNKDILFKEGISCSSMGIPFSACYLPSGATFGVNANIICKSEDIGWLLSYLNSSLVTYLVRGVLIRTNMITSGYVSRIPIIPLTRIQKHALESISEKALASKVINGNVKYLIKEIDGILYKELNFSAKILNEINTFCENLLRYT